MPDYCNRPFTTLDGQPDMPAMNRAIINGWNSVVEPEDLTFVLGDFGMGQWQEWAGLRKQLNGRIILILGNHDRKLETYLLPGDFAMDSLLTRDGVFMTHVPPGYVDQPRYSHDKTKINPVPEGTKLILVGHVHEKWTRGKDYNGVPVLNVGVDVRGYQPLTLEAILAQEGLDSVLG
jgi:calcineurin-like phosphoesterase family protein